MSYRCLRAANRGMYLGTTLLVLAACAYTLGFTERPAWQQCLAGLAALVTLVWGLYYALLRYEVSAQGVSHHSFGRIRCRILWEELAEATLDEQENMGMASCALTLRAQDGRSLCLSSELLAPEELQLLIAELREHGHLPPAPAED